MMMIPMDGELVILTVERAILAPGCLMLSFMYFAIWKKRRIASMAWNASFHACFGVAVFLALISVVLPELTGVPWEHRTWLWLPLGGAAISSIGLFCSLIWHG